MQVLWSQPDEAGLTVRRVHEELSRSREIAYTTVLTVLDRMAGKGVVTRKMEGRAYTYRAAGTRDGMTAEVMRQALEELADRDRSEALVAFVHDASEADREALRAALRALDSPGSGVGSQS